jgi:hypothetical protein
MNPTTAHEVQTEGHILIVVWESAGLRKGLVPERIEHTKKKSSCC